MRSKELPRYIIEVDYCAGCGGYDYLTADSLPVAILFAQNRANYNENVYACYVYELRWTLGEFGIARYDRALRVSSKGITVDEQSALEMRYRKYHFGPMHDVLEHIIVE